MVSPELPTLYSSESDAAGRPVNYDEAAAIYDRRFSIGGRQEVAAALVALARTSQLVVLSNDAYAAGVARIKAALARATAAGQELVLPVDISLAMVIGRVERV